MKMTGCQKSNMPDELAAGLLYWVNYLEHNKTIETISKTMITFSKMQKCKGVS